MISWWRTLTSCRWRLRWVIQSISTWIAKRDMWFMFGLARVVCRELEDAPPFRNGLPNIYVRWHTTVLIQVSSHALLKSTLLSRTPTFPKSACSWWIAFLTGTVKNLLSYLVFAKGRRTAGHKCWMPNLMSTAFCIFPLPAIRQLSTLRVMVKCMWRRKNVQLRVCCTTASAQAFAALAFLLQ